MSKANEKNKNVLKMPPRCGDCVHLDACASWNTGSLRDADASNCVNFYKANLLVKNKVCPFERQNAIIGGGKCLREKCAWWSDELKNCIVFAPIFESEESLRKEINTVIFGGVVQGGED